jgi:hypothetical protein
VSDKQYWRDDHLPHEIERLRELLKGHAEAPYLEAEIEWMARGAGDPVTEPRPDDFPGMDVTTAWLAARLVRDLYLFAEHGGYISERQWRGHCSNRVSLAERVVSQMTVAGRDAHELIFPEGPRWQ